MYLKKGDIFYLDCTPNVVVDVLPSGVVMYQSLSVYAIKKETLERILKGNYEKEFET